MNYKELTKKLVNEISKKYKIENSFDKLCIYVDLINKKNQLINLTAFKDDVLWEKGIYESISFMYQIFSNNEKFIYSNILDIGSGVGFPSIPFKIIFPKFKLTIHEPNKKRAIFLYDVAQYLKIDVNIKSIRTETETKIEIFDLVVARAVSSAKVLIEISSKVLKIKGKAFFMKGPAVTNELKDAKNILKILKFKSNIIKNTDSKIKGNLYLLCVEKNKKTPSRYPRSWVIISKESKH